LNVPRKVSAIAQISEDFLAIFEPDELLVVSVISFLL